MKVVDAIAEIMKREGVEFLSTYPTTPVIDIHFDLGATTLRFFSVVSTVGTPIDVTAQELRLEAFFPSDDATRDAWHQIAG